MKNYLFVNSFNPAPLLHLLKLKINVWGWSRIAYPEQSQGFGWRRVFVRIISHRYFMISIFCVHISLLHFFLLATVPGFLFPERENVKWFVSFLGVFLRTRSWPCYSATIQAVVGIWVLSCTFNWWDITAVPHAWPTQLAQIMQTAGNFRQEAKLVK